MADEAAAAGSGRNLRAVLVYILGIGLGIVVVLLLFGKRGELAAAWRQVSHVDVGWLMAAVAAEALSIWIYACLQHRILRLGGADIPMTALTMLSMANDAIANSVPGQAAVSGGYRYLYYRRYGASSASAAWTVFTTLVAQAIGMSLLLLLGVAVILARSRTAGAVGIAILGLIIVITAAVVLARRDLVLRLAGAFARALGRLTGHAGAGIVARVEATIVRMREIPLSGRSTAGIVSVATCVWLADGLCLICGFGAVHAAIPWTGVLLAYGVAQVAGALPIVPGGFGIVEGSLAVLLAAYGAGRVPALSATLVYRLVSFWLAIAVGWVCAGLIARQGRRSQRTALPASEPGLQVVAVLPPEEPQLAP